MKCNSNLQKHISVKDNLQSIHLCRLLVFLEIFIFITAAQIMKQIIFCFIWNF